jgi:nitrite reductase/ring-hydroxylating ferredoxin subunit
MDTPTTDFVRAASLEELKAKGRLVVHGPHRPILVVHDKGRVFALDNRCPHMGFPLDRGSVEDSTLTCHWHHARFDLASGCTFDLWADDVPTCPTEVPRCGAEALGNFVRRKPVRRLLQYQRQCALGNCYSLLSVRAEHNRRYNWLARQGRML